MYLKESAKHLNNKGIVEKILFIRYKEYFFALNSLEAMSGKKIY